MVDIDSLSGAHMILKGSIRLAGILVTHQRGSIGIGRGKVYGYVVTS